ncbi:MAG: O-antigen ligase family protein [Acidimicrobiales bacterium]
MTATAVGDRVEVYRVEAERPLPHWPVTLMIAGYPVWFLTGLGGFMWVILAVPMAVALLRRRQAVVPKGFGFWLLFLAAVVGSATSLDGFGRTAGYLLRLGYYGAATVFLLYLLNAGTSLPVSRIVRVFTIVYLATVTGGYLALVLGDWSFRSPTWYLMPHVLRSNELVNSLLTPGFADLQDIIGIPIPRPKAPFPYTNSWGSNLALLTPFALMALNLPGVGISRRVVRFALFASVIPAVVSLNRGLWLSLTVGLVYAAIRFGVGGQTRLLVRLAVGAVVLALIIVLSPLGGLVTSRIDNGHSDNDRTELATAAISGATERPLFGWGAPRPNVRSLPSIGTHGQLWMVTFSHGFVGAVGFVGALVSFWFHTRKQRTAVGVWANAVILIGITQIGFYLMIPNALFVVMAGVAVAARTLVESPRAVGSTPLGRRHLEDRQLVAPMSSRI